MRVRAPLSLALAVSTASAFALALQSPAQSAPVAAPAAASAAAFNQAYSTKASGEVLHVTALNAEGITGVLDAGVGISHGTTSGSPAHASTAESRNLDLALLGGNTSSLLAEAKQAAPPDNATPTTDTSLPVHLAPLVELDVSKASAHARTAPATGNCLPGNTSLSTSTVNTAGLTLLETGTTGAVAALPGTAKTTQASALIPNSSTTTDGRDVVSAVAGSAADIELLDGQLQVSVAEAPTLVATATGKTGGAKVAWDAPLLKITAGGTEYPLPVDGSPLNIVAPDNPLLGVTLKLGQLENVVEAADGTKASATASVLKVKVTLAGLVLADLDVFPFAVEAIAPVNGVSCKTDTTDPTGPDGDSDGLTDAEEAIVGTDPADPDSDDDGTNDGAEDKDGDGVTNLQEFRGSENVLYGKKPTNPVDADSDDDGLTDGQEIRETGTDPNVKDTDLDGINDDKEDPDQDGLTNLEEVTGSKNVSQGKAPTDPTDPDSDDGGVKDGVEVGRGTNPNNAADDNPTSPPANPDTDGDGLTDTQEDNLTKTDKNDADSDNDGVNDGAEDPDADGLSNIQEVNGTENDAFSNAATNPLDADSDDGGVKDGAEVYDNPATNPNVGADDKKTVPPSGPKVLCKGKVANIVGTQGADTLTGTPGRDVINGRDGNDQIVGLGGNDLICGGHGVDRISAGAGNDAVFAGRGDDEVLGGNGNDRLAGRQDDDRISGGIGNDLLYGGRHNDNLSGDAGNDGLYGHQGDDRLVGGAGKDKLKGGPGRDSQVQ